MIEILMVVTLVAIISAVAIPQFIDFRSDAKAAVTKERLASLRAAIAGDASSRRSGYISHLGAPPASLDDLAVQGGKPAYDPISKLGWNGPYIDASVGDWKKDAWGTDLSFDSAARTITSCGPNASCGDADDVSVSF